jgi:hypothetical protein
MVVTVTVEKVVKHAHMIETSSDYQAHGKSIDQRRTISSVLGGHHGRTSKYLISLRLKCTENGRWCLLFQTLLYDNILSENPASGKVIERVVVSTKLAIFQDL